MEGANIGFLVTYAGAVTIFVVFAVILYRVGHFNVMPGELRQQALNLVLVLSIGLAFALVPRVRWSLGSSGTWIIIVIGLGWVAMLLFGRRWLRRWISRKMEEQPPERQAEIARRTRFMRSREGRWLYAALFLTFIIWLVVANIATG